MSYFFVFITGASKEHAGYQQELDAMGSRASGAAAAVAWGHFRL